MANELDKELDLDENEDQFNGDGEEFDDDFSSAFDGDDDDNDNAGEKANKKKTDKKEKDEQDADDSGNDEDGENDSGGNDDKDGKGKSALELAEQRATEKDNQQTSEKNQTLKPEDTQSQANQTKATAANQDKQKSSVNTILEGLSEDRRNKINGALEVIPELYEVLDLILEQSGSNTKQESPEERRTREDAIAREAVARAKETEEKERLREDLAVTNFWLNLTRKKSNAMEISDSKEFQEWVKKQSSGINKLAMSLDPEDAILVLNAYEENCAKEKAKEIDNYTEAKRDKKKSLQKAVLKGGNRGKNADNEKDDFASGFDADDNEE